MEVLLSLAEVSDRYGIPAETLRWYRKVGRGPKSFKLGRRIRYRETDCEAWVQAQYDAENNKVLAQ
ncbi:helix-turn-helix transcriptional regulator [Cellulosimicrobium funkei]|uniref:helix-turn-helix transcriptional regulator n=1 Tax=Cellulosimicrobium funkei TaxID=264251 RepID=UPI00077484CD|nr:helix-turn-helix domain-containing protein [Cellulosimicrobium funkei]